MWEALVFLLLPGDLVGKAGLWHARAAGLQLEQTRLGQGLPTSKACFCFFHTSTGRHCLELQGACLKSDSPLTN